MARQAEIKRGGQQTDYQKDDTPYFPAKHPGVEYSIFLNVNALATTQQRAHKNIRNGRGWRNRQTVEDSAGGWRTWQGVVDLAGGGAGDMMRRRGSIKSYGGAGRDSESFEGWGYEERRKALRIGNGGRV